MASAPTGSGGRGRREVCDMGERVVSPVEKAKAPSAPCLLCLFRYKPAREVRTFHENSARLRAHGVQRRVHLPYVPRPQPRPGFRFCGEHGRGAAGRACRSGWPPWLLLVLTS